MTLLCLLGCLCRFPKNSWLLSSIFQRCLVYPPPPWLYFFFLPTFRLLLLRICANAHEPGEVRRGEGHGALKGSRHRSSTFNPLPPSTPSTPLCPGKSREDVRRLEDAGLPTSEAPGRARPPGPVGRGARPGLRGRVRARGEPAPHPPLPREQAPPHCAYRHPQITCIPKSGAQ